MVKNNPKVNYPPRLVGALRADKGVRTQLAALHLMSKLGTPAMPPPEGKHLAPPRTPRPSDEDELIRAAYGTFLRGVRRDLVRPFFMGASAAFGMSLGSS